MSQRPRAPLHLFQAQTVQPGPRREAELPLQLRYWHPGKHHHRHFPEQPPVVVRREFPPRGKTL